MSRKFLLVAVAMIGVLALAVAPTLAVDPTYTELVTAGTGVLTDAGVMTIVWAGAVIGLGVFLFRRFKSAAR